MVQKGAQSEFTALLGQDIIAKNIANLLRRVKEIERKIRDDERLDLNSGAAQGADAPGENVGWNTMFFHTVIVQGVDDANNCFSGRRAVPDATSLWIIDTDLTQSITVCFPDNVEAPAVGDVVSAQFTGLYGTFPLQQAQYGMFGAGGGGALFPYIVTAVNTDTLTCRSYRTDGTTTTVGSEDVTVAKPWDLQLLPWDGKTVDGLTYAYDIPNADREVTSVASPGITETQVVVPSYVTSFSIIYALTVSGGTGIQSVTLMDVNVAGRAWAQEFA